jgi:DUF1365 family protein
VISPGITALETPAEAGRMSGTELSRLMVEDVSSALYTGIVAHRRSSPNPHSFRYGVYYFLLNLDELEDVASNVTPLALNSMGLTSFHDADHFGSSARSVKLKLATWLQERGRELPGGPVLLLTNLRVFGYVFNPVSYYYCCDPKGRLAFVVAEVNNTFGETYCYLLDDFEPLGPRAVRARRTKVFHVSPFIEIDGIEYDWIFTAPSERLTVHIDEFRGGQKFFDATLQLKRKPLTTRSLMGAMASHPHTTAHTMARIHWQALKLWWKGAPFFSKPDPPVNGLLSAEEDR